jgi:hypothetical protein
LMKKKLEELKIIKTNLVLMISLNSTGEENG